MNDWIKVSYSEFKTFCTERSLSPQLVGKLARAKDDYFGLECLLDSDDLIDLQNTFQVNQILKLLDSQGKPLVSSEKPYGNFDTIITPNFCVDAGPFEVKPSANKTISIVKAECQFEHDLVFDGAVFILDYYIWFDHPQAGTIEVVAQSKTFPSLRSLFELGNEHYHSPAIGSEMPNGVTTISFSYPQKLLITSQQVPYELSKLVCRLENDQKPLGSYVTIGFVTEEGSL